VVAAIVLAAGAASRFGSPKQRLFAGEVVARVRRSAAGARVVVVTGAHEVAVDADVVHCPDWAAGPGASLRCGLAALGDAEAAVVVLADGPDLAPAAVDRLVTLWHEERAPYLAASYGGVRGHPVLLAREAWSGIPDEGLRGREPLLVPCDDLGPPGDVDFADDVPERFTGAAEE
jgi:CTP:molybdopterin cytidylyltransferase MocA